MRLDGSYVSSSRLSATIAVVDGDIIKINYTITWDRDASRQQWMREVAKMPKARFGHPSGQKMLEINDWDLMVFR